MGAQHSVAVQRELKQLKEIALLDRDTVTKMIIELNEAGLDLRGREASEGRVHNDHLLKRFSKIPKIHALQNKHSCSPCLPAANQLESFSFRYMSTLLATPTIRFCGGKEFASTVE